MQRVYEENEWGKVSKRIITAATYNRNWESLQLQCVLQDNFYTNYSTSCNDMVALPQVDCPGFGPGPLGPGSRPDWTHRSECPGQSKVGPDLYQGVRARYSEDWTSGLDQVQTWTGPILLKWILFCFQVYINIQKWYNAHRIIKKKNLADASSYTNNNTLVILMKMKMIIQISYSVNFCTSYKNCFYWGPGPLMFTFRARFRARKKSPGPGLDQTAGSLLVGLLTFYLLFWLDFGSIFWKENTSEFK